MIQTTEVQHSFVGTFWQGQPWGWVASPAPSTPSDVEQSQEALRAFQAFQAAEQAGGWSFACIMGHLI